MEAVNSVQLSYEDLASYTDNFSKESYLGDFQFGKFYRGKIIVYEGDNQLKLIDEMILLCHEKLITHPGKVKLFGYCVEGGHLGLVYDFKPFDSVCNLIRKGKRQGISMEQIKSYQSQVELLLTNYVFADSFIAYAFVIIGNFACKTVYELSRLISNVYFKSYPNLTRSQQVEWNNRAMSTFHAVYITTASLYFVFWSDLYIDDALRGPITLRSSMLSSFALGVSVGYFLSDLGMIIWSYPSLGGMEYVIHHLLSLVAEGYAMLMGEAQHYTFLVLLSEATTPSINLRWYLDAAQMKRSRAYIVNGDVIFLTWLVARILWFLYLFFHAYRHRYQVMEMHKFGVALILVVPAVMNLMWFWKIFKGMKKL